MTSKNIYKLSVDEKYRLYEGSVQNTGNDIEFINREFNKLRGRAPRNLREDFGGTGKLACDWVKIGPENYSWAIDLDPEPIDFGRRNHFSSLTTSEQERVNYILGNVLDPYEFKPDINVAFNFSYFIFKTRAELKNYFTKVREGLADDGLFVVDIFGGTEGFQPLVEETEHDEHSYYWDCDSYNPINHHIQYYIHFKTKDDVKHEKVFSYDWRMWSIAEIREIMEEAGFKRTISYWEGEDGEGGGDGEFYITENAENCESWVTYIIGIK